MTRRYQPRLGSPDGPLDLGETVRVVAYVPAKLLAQFDEVAEQQAVSRSAAIVDAIGWWFARKQQVAIRGERQRRHQERRQAELTEAGRRQLQADQEAIDMAVWRDLLEDARRRRSSEDDGCS